jgi:hypothetical protein
MVTAETNSWIVLLQPRHTEDNIMGCGGDVQAQRFFTAGCPEDEGVVMRNVSRSGWGSIGEDKGNRVLFRETWKLVALRQFVINETTLTTTIYHSSSRLPFLRLRRFDIDIDVGQGAIFGFGAQSCEGIWGSEG